MDGAVLMQAAYEAVLLCMAAPILVVFLLGLLLWLFCKMDGLL